MGKYEVVDKYNSITKALSLSYIHGVSSIKAVARKVGKLWVILDVVTDCEAIIMGLGRFAGDTFTDWTEDGKETLKLLGLKFIKVK